jgi:hypothetical protein
MKRLFRVLIPVLAILTPVVLNSGCDKSTFENQGILEGKISIGPLCPVETDPPQQGCLPTAETYKAYPVDIFTADGESKICTIEPNIQGFYSKELEPGKYLIVLENINQGIGGCNLPVEVTILPDKVTALDISIDTGIR